MQMCGHAYSDETMHMYGHDTHRKEE